MTECRQLVLIRALVVDAIFEHIIIGPLHFEI